MARRKREKKVASSEVEAQTEAALEERQASATDQARKEVDARGVLAEALLSEGGGGEEGVSREEAARKEDAEAREAAEREWRLKWFRELVVRSRYDKYGDMREGRADRRLLELLPELNKIQDEELRAQIAEGMLWVPGTTALDFVEKHAELIPKERYRGLCEELLGTANMSESAAFFLKQNLPNLGNKEKSAVIRNALDRRSWAGNELLKSIFSELQLEQHDRDDLLFNMAFWKYGTPELDFMRTHLGEASAATRHKIIDRLQVTGYSLVEGEAVEKVDSSLRLMDEMAKGFLLSDWRERNRKEYVAFDLADAPTLQQALEEAAQRKFDKPLSQLGSGEMQELLSDATAKEIDEELRPKIEAEMEPSTFTLFVRNWTKSSDRANRCVEALSVKLYGKEVGELSRDEFRELLGRDQELIEWIDNDQFEQFKQEVEGELVLREAELDVVHAEAVARAHDEKEVQIQQAVAGFETALKAMPGAAGYVTEALAAVREQMSEKIRERYEKTIVSIGKRHQRAKESFREVVADFLRQAVEDMKGKKGKMYFTGGRFLDTQEYGEKESVTFRGSISGSSTLDAKAVLDKADEEVFNRNEDFSSATDWVLLRNAREDVAHEQQ